LPGCDGRGAVCVDVVEVDVEVELEVELDVELEVEVDELDVELELEVVLLLVVDVVIVGVAIVDVVDVEPQSSATTTAPVGTVAGSWTFGSGVSCVASTGTWIVVPSISLTVAVQESAAATGISAIAWMASTVTTVASATVSFRLLNTVV
jgi:hypothetical protein